MTGKEFLRILLYISFLFYCHAVSRDSRFAYPDNYDYYDQLQQASYRNLPSYPDYLNDGIQHLKSPSPPNQPINPDLFQTNYYDLPKHLNYPNQFRLHRHSNPEQQHYQQDELEKVEKFGKPKSSNDSEDPRQLNHDDKIIYPNQLSQFNYQNREEQHNQHGENNGISGQSQVRSYGQLLDYQGPFNYLKNSIQLSDYLSRDRQPYRQSEFEKFVNLGQPQRRNFYGNEQLNNQTIPNHRSQSQQFDYPSQHEQVNPQANSEKYSNFDESQLRNFVVDQLLNYRSPLNYPSHFQQPSYLSQNGQISHQNELQKLKNIYEPHLRNFVKEKKQFHYRSMPNYLRQFQQFNYPTKNEQLNPRDKFEDRRNFDKSNLRNFVEEDKFMNYRTPINYHNQFQQPSYRDLERQFYSQNEFERFGDLDRPHPHNFAEENQQLNYRSIPNYPSQFQKFSQDEWLNPYRFENRRNFEQPQLRHFANDQLFNLPYHPDQFRHHGYFLPYEQFHQPNEIKQFRNFDQPQPSDQVNPDKYQLENFRDSPLIGTFDRGLENIVPNLESLADAHPEKQDPRQADSFRQSNQSDEFKRSDEFPQFNHSNGDQKHNHSENLEQLEYQYKVPMFTNIQENQKLNYTALIHEICPLKMMHGPCNAAFHRYFYNAVTGNCERFVYGGCYGNANNFFTKEECEAMCKSQ